MERGVGGLLSDCKIYVRAASRVIILNAMDSSGFPHYKLVFALQYYVMLNSVFI